MKSKSFLIDCSYCSFCRLWGLHNLRMVMIVVEIVIEKGGQLESKPQKGECSEYQKTEHYQFWEIFLSIK